MTLWIDIDDLLTYLAHHSRPSGIQRVVYEISGALHHLGGRTVRFVRRGENWRDLRVVDWSFAQALFDRMTFTPVDRKSSEWAPAAQTPDEPETETSGLSSQLPAFVVPASDSTVSNDSLLGELLQIQKGSLQQALSVPGGFARVTERHVSASLKRQRDIWQTKRDQRKEQTAQKKVQQTRIALPPGAPLTEAAGPGDIFLTLGAPWHHADYATMVRWIRDDLRMSYGLLMYDLVPIRHPEWCTRDMIQDYTDWHQAILPLADRIFAISQATARDVESYLKEQGIDTPVQAIPLGTSFGLAETATASEALVDEPYALFVSTIEARKNHALLFRVWRQLLEDMPAEKVPTLVFAGREGWLVSDLMQQLENSRWLNGKIRFIQNPTDGELRRLYADCSFTLFPSFFEGWGLPVTESLSMGRPCIASNTTSIPEAGGSLGRYFNPCSLKEAYTVIRQTIEDPEGLTAWTQQVRTEFKPRPWAESAKTILATLETL
ncbi:glycosyltransferase family 4 protein [Gluconobacter roseus]|uniref:glycosyltransferase family 4 protein n=1 Tax=Gluconobacter roseus TaxID=586239 RepID=UPI0038CFBCE9